MALVKLMLMPGPEAGLPQNHAAPLQHGTPSGSRGNSPGHVTVTATPATPVAPKYSIITVGKQNMEALLLNITDYSQMTPYMLHVSNQAD